MKTKLMLFAVLLVLPFSSLAGDYLPLRDAMEKVMMDYLVKSRPSHAFTLARPAGVGDEWAELKGGLETKILRAMGPAAKHFVPFAEAKPGRLGGMMSPAEESLDVFHINSVQYIDSNTLEIGVSAYRSPSIGHGAVYKVTLKEGGPELELMEKYGSGK